MGLFIAPLKMTAVPWWKALPGQWETAPNIGFCQSWSARFQKIFTSETEMYVKILRTANSRLGSTELKAEDWSQMSAIVETDHFL